MFHDRSLHTDSKLISLAFELNAQACRLASFVEYYRKQGNRTLPVQYLKRLAFTRRQWELATKGSRPYEGRKLIDPAPAKDGLEKTGLVSEYTEVDPKTNRPKTYWIIGEIDQEVIEAIRKERQDADFDVIEDRAPDADDIDADTVEPSRTKGATLPTEDQYDLGYAEGEAAGYVKGVRDTGCVKDAPLIKAFRTAYNTHPAETRETDFLRSFWDEARNMTSADRLDAQLRAESEANLGF